jgi:hypothetical protein
MRLAEFNEGPNDERVPSKDGLVQGQLDTAIDARLPLLHQEVENVKIKIARCTEQLRQGTLFMAKDVDIVVLLINQLPDSLIIRKFASKVQRSRYDFLVLRFLILELLVIPHLCHVNIACLDGVVWESLNEKEVVSQYAQSERLLKSVF